jgi:Myosin N-terminal SH3-like domain
MNSIPALYAQVKPPKGPPPLPAKGKALPPVPPAAARPAATPASTFSNSSYSNGASSSSSSGTAEAVPGMSSAASAALTSAANWLEKRTADGVPYYFNTATETCDWDKPDCLKSAEELDTGAGAWCWVSDEKEAFVPARILKGAPGDSSVSVQLQNGTKRSVKAGPSEPLFPLKPSSLTRSEDDLVMVDDINPALMVHSLRERYRRDRIYTWVGANHSVRSNQKLCMLSQSSHDIGMHADCSKSCSEQLQ